MEKPILFSTPMVQQLPPRGIKTQTRRVAKIPKWTTDSYDELFIDVHGNLCATCDDTGCDSVIKPYYQPGDVLWVRETWCKLWALDNNDQIIEGTEKYYYAANGYNPTPFNHFPDENGFSGDRDCPKWRPSIHMPKEAARLFLRVTDVRAEQLQDISIRDVLAEGIDSDGTCRQCHENYGTPCCKDDESECGMLDEMICEYQSLWDSLNAKRDGGKYAWDKNPWVWVYTFGECEKPAGWSNLEAL